jgi:UDP-N-acetylmuramoyl-tripeptide--D-alanyl-D-alanine ligase
MSYMMTLQDVAAATGGSLVGDEETGIRSVSTDSRTIGHGQLFIALSGANFDGHGYVAAARQRGACAALIAAERLAEVQAANPELPLVAVADTRLALGDLAGWWRNRFTLPVIAVTGSNGKTTTKEMIASVLAAAVEAEGGIAARGVLATQGNLNNDIGLPLTLLQLTADHRYAIIEMGMNHPGEIGYLTRIARPNVALVTNAQRAHLQGMGDLTAVAEEKGTIFDGLHGEGGGIAVINADDPHASLWLAKNAQRRIITFALDHPAAVRGQVQLHGLETVLTVVAPEGEARLQLNLPGLHNARNALAAAAATLAAGISIDAVAAGLGGFAGVKGRLQQRAGQNGAVILDDTYNANPDSVRAGIDVLATTIGHTVLVLGDMGEIGDMSGQCHDEIGGYAKSQGIDKVFTFGEASAVAARNFGAGAQHFDQLDPLIAAVRKELSPTTTVLVKGSRFMRMERVADALAQEQPAATGAAKAAGENH